jgi:similar to stage IV sporulation protein
VRMWNFLTGYVMIRVDGLSLEKFLNMAAEAGVRVYDVRRASYTVLHATVSPRGLKKLQSIAPEKYAVAVRKSAGLAVGMKRLMRRRALIIGLALVLLAAVAASFFVWEVRVAGIDARDAIALKEELITFGIYPGAFKGNIDLRGTETTLIISHDEFAWIDIKFSGVAALVTVVPAELPPEVVDDSRPCNIVAKKDALIESVTALSGKAAVKPGQTVRAGDVVISGLVWDEGFPRLMFAARGKVIGRVWYRAGETAPVSREERVPTGRVQTQRIISVGADTAPVDPGCTFAEYDTQPVGQYPVVGLFLPVTITTLKHSEVEIKARDVPRDLLELYLEERAYFKAQGYVPDNADIVGHRTIFKEEDGMLTATVYIETHEDIGAVVYLEE